MVLDGKLFYRQCVMPSTRFDAMVSADHIRGYRDRIDILNHAIWVVDNEMEGLEDEPTISRVLKDKLKDHIDKNYPRPVPSSLPN